MNTKMRYTTLTALNTANSGNASSFFAGNSEFDNQGSSGQIGIDEVVFSPAGGVLASIQDPPSLANLLNSNQSNGVACSFVM